MSDRTLGIVGDIGGTHARFAVASMRDGAVELARVVKAQTADYASFEAAFDAYRRTLPAGVPPRASLAFASPIAGDEIKLTNCPWAIRPQALRRAAGLEELHVLNDFGAVARAIPLLPADSFVPLSRGDFRLPQHGVVSVLGLGTGFGVAMLHRTGQGDLVIETEGGHLSFSPSDAVEDAIAAQVRRQYARISAERMTCGSGLGLIYRALAAVDGRVAEPPDDVALWNAALASRDPYASAALERLCLIFGTAAGDLALAQGAKAVVLAGGLLMRMLEPLKRSGFMERFLSKGRFRALMQSVAVAACVHPEPGLIGAADLLRVPNHNSW